MPGERITARNHVWTLEVTAQFQQNSDRSSTNKRRALQRNSFLRSSLYKVTGPHKIVLIKFQAKLKKQPFYCIWQVASVRGKAQSFIASVICERSLALAMALFQIWNAFATSAKYQVVTQKPPRCLIATRSTEHAFALCWITPEAYWANVTKTVSFFLGWWGPMSKHFPTGRLAKIMF